MNKSTLTTSWMWIFDGQIHGLHIDTDRGLLQWHDNFECACVDDEGSFANKTLADYLAQGARQWWANCRRTCWLNQRRDDWP